MQMPRISIVKKCLLSGILAKERADNYLYPVMAIFSRRYL